MAAKQEKAEDDWSRVLPLRISPTSNFPNFAFALRSRLVALLTTSPAVFPTLCPSRFLSLSIPPVVSAGQGAFLATMSLARPARCLFCSFSRAASAVGPRVPRRQFHPSPPSLNSKPKPPNGSESELKSLYQISREMKQDDFKPYTEEEKAGLREVYTPEQIAAIEAGEAAIDPKDMADQFAFRTDPMKLRCLDDFSTIEPGVDKHVRAPVENTDYDAKMKTREDFVQDLAKYFMEMPEDASAGHFVRFLENVRVTHGKEENELNPHSALVPDFISPGETLTETGKVTKTVFTDAVKKRLGEDLTAALKRLIQDTGYSEQHIRNLKTKALVTHRVVNQTRLGKIASTYSLAIAGNGRGLLGIGEAKSDELPDAKLQATYRAIRNMQPIPRYEQRTIYGDVRGKVGAVDLKLMNRPPGEI